MSKLPLEDLRFGGGARWHDSLRIGLERGLWRAPESFIDNCLLPMLASLFLIARHLWAICMVPVVWTFMHLLIIGAGLCGKLRAVEADRV